MATSPTAFTGIVDKATEIVYLYVPIGNSLFSRGGNMIGRRTALAGLALAVMAVASAGPVAAQTRSSQPDIRAQTLERPLYQAATVVIPVRLDSLFPLGSPLDRTGSLLIGNVHGVMSVAVQKAGPNGIAYGAAHWISVHQFMDYVADSNYTPYIRPVALAEYQPPNSHTLSSTERASVMRVHLASPPLRE